MKEDRKKAKAPGDSDHKVHIKSCFIHFAFS